MSKRLRDVPVIRGNDLGRRLHHTRPEYALGHPLLSDGTAQGGDLCGDRHDHRNLVLGHCRLARYQRAVPGSAVCLCGAEDRGGLYLVWLGIRVFLDVRNARKTPDLIPAKVDIPFKTAYRMGLATNLANPKSALFVASLFAVTMPAGTPFLYGIAAIGVMVTVSTFYYGCLISLITHPRVAAGYLKAKQKIDLGVATVFVGFGTKLLLSQR